jgi:hypothetical protein
MVRYRCFHLCQNFDGQGSITHYERQRIDASIREKLEDPFVMQGYCSPEARAYRRGCLIFYHQSVLEFCKKVEVF